MEKLQPLSSEDIMKQLKFDRFIPDSKKKEKKKEKKLIVQTCEEVLKAQINNTEDQAELVERTLEFIKALWSKYDCKEVADKYDSYIKMEGALFGLEREEDEKKNRSYRDHFVHMFNTFILGLRIIAMLHDKLNEKNAKKVLKVEDENFKRTELAKTWSKEYSYIERTFYLWMLIATFHDIAIPFEHMKRIGTGISKFVEEFGWTVTGPDVSIQSFDSSQLYKYFDVLSRIYGGGLIKTAGGRYRRAKKPYYYIVKLLGRAFDQTEHGILSGFFMWRTIEDIFLCDLSKHKLKTSKKFNAYTELVLEQDIARAALAISLHSLKKVVPNASPKIYPVDFKKFPLAFLLILSDELQEYHRWEGTSIRGEVKFRHQPILKLEIEDPDNVKLKVIFSIDKDQEQQFIDISERAKDIKDAMKQFLKPMKDALGSKIATGEHFKLNISVYQDWEQRIYNEEVVHTKANAE